MRLFIALLLDGAARDQLRAMQRALGQRDPGARLTRPENLHLTLAFLGESAARAGGGRPPGHGSNAPAPPDADLYQNRPVPAGTGATSGGRGWRPIPPGGRATAPSPGSWVGRVPAGKAPPSAPI